MLAVAAIGLVGGFLAFSNEREMRQTNLVLNREGEKSAIETTKARYADNARELPLDPALLHKTGITVASDRGDLVRTFRKDGQVGPLTRKRFGNIQSKAVVDYNERYAQSIKSATQFPDKKKIILSERDYPICWVNAPHPKFKEDWVNYYPYSWARRPQPGVSYADTGLGNFSLDVDSLTTTMTSDRLKPGKGWNRKSPWAKTIEFRGIANRGSEFTNGLETNNQKRVTFRA